MIIDPDTLTQRNVGCFNNTMAHEAFHWHKHRHYHILKSVQPIDKLVCPSDEPDEKEQIQWSDEDWMEWQARGIAPRILMPVETVKTVFDQVITESQNNPFIAADLMPPDRWVIEQMAAFYKVSKQAAGIRLTELGLLN
jgi:Zn-dependent peptidase ImmA (M78 family)